MYKVYYKGALIAADLELWTDVVATVDNFIESRDLPVVMETEEYWGETIEYIDWEAMEITYKEYKE